jgi:hypothetical protein
MHQHKAKEVHILRSEPGVTLSTALARSLGESHFRIRTREPRWASFSLDGANIQAQNTMLKTLEEMPKHGRVILRARSTGVLPTIRSRCAVVTLSPGKPQEEMDLLEAAGLDPGEAEILTELRPGRPGEAIRLAEYLPLRARADGLLAAAEARDNIAVSAGLVDFEDETRLWIAEWLGQAISKRTPAHLELAKTAGIRRLRAAHKLASDTHNPRLAVRAAMIVLMGR